MSAINEKRQLVRRLENVPALETALRARTFGYESMRLVAKIATPNTIHQWIARAEERTVRHLREEMDIAEMIARLSNDSAPEPPTEERVAQFQSVEGRITSGAAFARTTGTAPLAQQISAPGAPDVTAGDSVAAEGTKRGCQTSAPEAAEAPTESQGESSDTVAAVLTVLLNELEPTELRAARSLRSRGRVTLKLRVRSSTYRDYRRLERRFLRVRHDDGSFLRFLCVTLIDTWKYVLFHRVAYGHIYARDCYRCKNPVCGHRQVTPHHLRFRSADSTSFRLKRGTSWETSARVK